jgi:gluconolactonase
VFDFAPGRGGDGMEVDADGTLYVCAGVARPSFAGETDLYEPGVYLIEPDGRLRGVIPVPEDRVSNCCFAGEDLRTLVVTSGRTLFATRVETPGYHAFPCAVEKKGAHV